MFGDDVSRLRATPGHKSIAVGKRIRRAPVSSAKRSCFNIGLNTARDPSRLICISAEAANAQRIDGETLERGYGLQVGIKLSRHKSCPVERHSLLEAGL